MSPVTDPVCLISRVDMNIRMVNLREYHPRRVSIGPFFEEASQRIGEEKKDRLYRALSIPRNQEQADEQARRRSLDLLAGHLERAELHYDMLATDMTHEQFAFMLLRDGYFVLSYFGLVKTEAGWEEREKESIEHDRDIFCLCENQVPFFILKKIYELLDRGRVDEPSSYSDSSIVLRTIARHIKTFVHDNDYVHESVTFNMEDDDDPGHLVHLLYKYFPPPANLGRDEATEEEATDDDDTLPSWHSAAYYYAAGVRLAKRQLDRSKARSILDFKLEKGTLQIPSLVIQNSTLTILRNMVALEQCNPNVGSHVSCYCLFMSKVANTEEDVRLLRSKKIIVNYLCSDRDVVQTLADLCRGVNINKTSPEFKYHKHIMRRLEKLSRSRWGKSMAWLQQHKCNNILMTLAVVAGIIIFLCTVEQSVFAALSYGMKQT